MTPEETITQLRAELAALRQEQQTFAATVTHDLRAPLRHIGAYAQLLREDAAGVLHGEALGFIDTITQAAHTLTAQLDALSAYAQLATVALHPQRVALQTAVSGCIEDLKASTPASGGLHVHWEVSVGEAVVWADAALLQQALHHVLGNAVYFSQTQVSPLVQISMETASPARDVVLVITDNGMGCDLTHADRLFSVFARLHSPRQLKGLAACYQPAPGWFCGLGMGLASTRRIMQRMGGTVTLLSLPDAGCTVRLQLPGAL